MRRSILAMRAPLSALPVNIIERDEVVVHLSPFLLILENPIRALRSVVGLSVGRAGVGSLGRRCDQFGPQALLQLSDSG
jgi:hypothetical protein